MGPVDSVPSSKVDIKLYGKFRSEEELELRKEDIDQVNFLTSSFIVVSVLIA